MTSRLRTSFVPLLAAALVLLLWGVSAPGAPAQDRPDRAEVPLRGQVLADDTGAPLQGATVAVLRAPDATLVTGGITDAEGEFRVGNVPAGRYHVRISFIGFAPVEWADLRLGPDAPAQDLGVVRLAPATAEAEGVEVTARRELMEVQIDRTVFNVKDQITAVGGSASDVLQDLPSIEVDIDGTVSYRGNENVAIHINGRPSTLSGEALASFLKSLSAETVERVEVIPTPSARYEPDGLAGIINIVLVKNRAAGWSGGGTAGGGTNESYNGSVNVGYRSGDWRLFSTYGYRYDTRESSGTRLRETLLQSPSVLLNQRSADERTRQSHAWTTQTEYRAGTGTTLGLQTVLSTRGGSEDGHTTYEERRAGVLDTEFARLVDGTRDDLGFDTRLSLDHDFAAEDHTLSAELRYEREWEDETGRYAEHPLLDGGAIGDPVRRDDEWTAEAEQEGTLRLDYTRPLGALALETGYQGSLRAEETDQRYQRTLIDDPAVGTTISAFGFDEQIHAGYGILSADLGPLGLQAGLRAEQALTTFVLDASNEAFDNDYFGLFPSAFLTYEPTEGWQVRLSYSKRVNRPRTWQLNPIDDNEDPTFRRVGNPFLRPEYVHAVEASYVRHWSALTLTTSPYVRRTVNEVQWVETFSADGVTTLSFANAAASSAYGAELIAALSLGPRLRGTASLNGYRVVTDASNLDTDLSNDALAYSGRANLTVRPRDGLDLQLSQYYRSPISIAGGRIGARSMTTVGARQEMLGGRASLGLQARDVLGTMGFHIRRRADSFYQVTDRDWGARQLSVSLTYNFGRSGPARPDRGGRGGADGFGGEGEPMP